MIIILILFVIGCDEENPVDYFITASGDSRITPANFKITNGFKVMLSWNPVSEADGYNVYRGESETGSYSKLTATPITTTTYTDNEVAQSSTYYYRVTAYNTIRESPCSSGNVTVNYIPTQVIANAGITNINLSWSPINGATGYNIYRETSASGLFTKTLNSSIMTTTSYTDLSVTAIGYTTYYYKITALDGSNESGQSTVVKATTGLQLLGSYSAPYSLEDAKDVFVSGNYAYVADPYSGLKIIDISNPAKPTLAGSYSNPGYAKSVYVSGNYAYLATGWCGLMIIDISNPANPKLTGTYDTPDDALDVYVSDNYAYVADGYSGLLIIDISNPAGPTLTGSYPGYYAGICVSDNYAYVAEGSSGLQIIDISDQTKPISAGNYNTSISDFTFHVSGNYAYVVDGSSGLHIINISNPANPTLTGIYNGLTNPYAINVSGNYAYVTTGFSQGLYMIDVSSPSSPKLTTKYPISGHTFGVYVSNNIVYVGTDNHGLQILGAK